MSPRASKSAKAKGKAKPQDDVQDDLEDELAAELKDPAQDEDVLEDLGEPQFEEETPAAVSAPAKRADKKSKPGVVLEKPRANIYTVLLILTFVALVVGSSFLYGELTRYDWKIKVPH